MAGAKKTAQAAPPAASEAGERVVMVVLEPVKYGGKRHQPGDTLLAMPDDVEGLTESGLAEAADIPETPAE